MQTILHYLAFLLSFTLLQAQNSINLEITGFKNDLGKVRVALYSQEDQFLEVPFMAQNALIKNNVAYLIFKDVPQGTYAISCYHDEDNDNKMKMRFGFIPVEDYGCSNNARGFMGPPSWHDAKFTVANNEEKKIMINLN